MPNNRIGERRFDLDENLDILYISGRIGREEYEMLKEKPTDQLRTALQEKGVGCEQKTKNSILFLAVHRLERPLCTSKDIAHLVQFSVFPKLLPTPQWTIFKNFRRVPTTLVLRVNAPTELVENTYLPFLSMFFNNVKFPTDPDVVSPDVFWANILASRIPMCEMMRKNSQAVEEGQNELNELMGPSPYTVKLNEMTRHSYPFPGDEEIVPTKQLYRRITPNSPLYAIDCDMCVTSARTYELTRISIVNEEGQLLLDTLVKPDNEITRSFALIKKKLENVTTRLKDVQEAIQSILSPDAILVAHSLENDLRAIKMAHPYCIDVSFLLTYEGKKNGLHKLAKMFLDEKIQNRGGYCSHRNAWTAMKLAKLKMEKGLEFGDVKRGWKFEAFLESKKKQKEGREKREEDKKCEEDKKGKKEEEKENEGEREEEKNDNKEALEESAPVSKADEKPRPSCSTCQQPTTVECKVKNCTCRSVAGPSLCVQCQKKVPPEQGTINWKNHLKKKFSAPKTRSLEKLCNSREKSVMMAINDQTPSGIERLIRLNRARFGNTHDFVTSCANQMIQTRGLNLIELDYEKPTAVPNGEASNPYVLDSYIRTLIEATPQNTLVVFVIASDTRSFFNAALKKY